MTANRREILHGGLALTGTALLPRFAFAEGAAPAPAIFAPKPGPWRTFEITKKLEILKPQGVTQAWIPIPDFTAEDWTKPGAITWATSGKAVEAADPKSGATMVHVVWKETEAAPAIEVVSRVTTRDRAIDVASKGSAKLSDADRKHYTAATELLPTDGIVKETADKATTGAKTELEKARAIYEWIVDNTFRDPKTKGCGVGDIASLLKSGNLGGKCADLNALFVGLARASGLPARDIYGIRIAPSAFGYKSLGANAATITKAQHCRAEVFVDGLGWVPADPADVRKVVLEEPPGNLAATDEKVVAARKALFGSWETNWLAYNDAHDVSLPGSSGPKLGFLMYPQAETAGGRVDCLDADNFKYAITTKEIVA